MKLHVDLESLQLIEGPGFRNPVTTLRFKRGDSALLEVSFLEGGSTPASIGDPAQLELRFGIKPRNRYDVGYLVHSADWTMPAPEAESPVYLCSPSFNTVELDSALGVGSSTGTELSEITLMGEITWREGGGEPTSTRTFLVIVENDVNRGTEGVLTDADPAYPAPASLLLKAELDQRAVRYDAAQTPLDATQLGQFLDNLGRDGFNLLDLTGGGSNNIVLGVSGLACENFYESDGVTQLMYVVGPDVFFVNSGVVSGSQLHSSNEAFLGSVLSDNYCDSGGSTIFQANGGETGWSQNIVTGPMSIISDSFAAYNSGSYLFGAWGSFTSQEGYTVTVSAGLITDIT